MDLAKERLKIRVKEGGHNIPKKVIERRYFKRIDNLFGIYLSIIDGVLIFDNSYGKHELIAHKMGTENIEIVDQEKFEQLKKVYDSKR